MSNEIGKRLSPEEIRFIEIYFENGFNATRAYEQIKPKASLRTCQVNGWKMLQRTDVKDEVDRRLIAFRANRRLTVEQFGDTLLEAATGDVFEFYDAEGKLKPLSEIPPHARRQIASIEPVEVIVTRGNKLVHEIRNKVKLWDKTKAAELWGKYQKMFTDKVDVTSGGKALAVNVTINGIKKG